MNLKRHRFLIILPLFLLICFWVFRWTADLAKIYYVVYPGLIFAYVWTYSLGILLALEGMAFRPRFRVHAGYLALTICLICIDLFIGLRISYASFVILLRIAAGFCAAQAVLEKTC